MNIKKEKYVVKGELKHISNLSSQLIKSFLCFYRESEEYMPFILAITEHLNNIVIHNHSGAKAEKINVEIFLLKNKATATIIDRGKDYTPIYSASTSLPNYENRPEGGWGIMIIKKYTDTLSFKRENGVNTMSIEKIFNT